MALRRRLQGVYHAQQSTFPGPAESNNPKDIPLFHFQVHMLEGLDGTAAHLEGLADILELDQLQHLSKEYKKRAVVSFLQRRWLVVPLWFTGIQRPASCARVTAATPGSPTVDSKARLTEAFAQVVDLPALSSCQALCRSSPAVLFPLIAFFNMPISYYEGGILSRENVDFFQTVEM